MLPVAGAFLLILSGPQTWFSRHVLANRVMVFIGAISYPLYLWHWPLLSFTQIIDSEMTPRGRNMAFLASFLLAWLTYRFLEKPLRALGKSALKTATLCIMLTLLAALGLASLQQDGAAMREHAAISKLNPFDFPYKGSCAKLMHAEFGDDWCNEGNAGLRAPNTVLIGDSFSNAYADMLTEYAHNEKINPPVFRQFGRGQCPALLDYGPLACRQITFAAADYIRDTPAVGTVIIAAHWHAYFSGKKYPVPEQKETAESFYRAFTQTIEFYQGLGKRVVVFLAPPTGANPRSCIPRPVYLGKNNICNLSADEARKNDGLYRERLLPYLAERKVAIFDPFKVLCEAGNCKLMEQDRILYNDLYHLSRFGGQFLARSGREQLDQALQAPKLP